MRECDLSNDTIVLLCYPTGSFPKHIDTEINKIVYEKNEKKNKTELVDGQHRG